MAQLAPTLVSLFRRGDTNRLTVQLEPAELGRVQIHVERHSDGPILVTLTADRSQTLDLLVRDTDGLHRALDQAGIPADGRSVTFRLADSAAAPAGAAPTFAPPSDTPAPATPAMTAPAGGGATSADAGGGSGGFMPRDGGSSGQRRSPGRQDSDDNPQSRTRWLRAGIDITA
jgi:hypothetical protein